MGGIETQAKRDGQNLAVFRLQDGHNDLSQICRSAGYAVRDSATVDVASAVALLVLGKSLVSRMRC